MFDSAPIRKGTSIYKGLGRGPPGQNNENYFYETDPLRTRFISDAAVVPNVLGHRHGSRDCLDKLVNRDDGWQRGRTLFLVAVMARGEHQQKPQSDWPVDGLVLVRNGLPRVTMVRMTGATEAVDVLSLVQHHRAMKTLSEIEKAVQKLSSEQKQELIEFLSALLQRESKGPAHRDFAPAERAAELERWAASHEPGPGLPDSALGRDSIYD